MRKQIMVVVPKSGSWPDGTQPSGAVQINTPFNWIRIHHRNAANTANVLVDFDGYIVNDDTLFWESIAPGDRRVRNIAGPPGPDGQPLGGETWPNRVYFRNLDAANDAHLSVEVADHPIVDLNQK